MKKVLIYVSKSSLAPTGGPSGYLYALTQSLKTDCCDEISIDFLPAVEKKKNKLVEFGKKTKNPVFRFFAQQMKDKRHYNVIHRILSEKVTPPVNLNDYDLIHFHYTNDIYMLRDELKLFKGKTILTSHSPQPFAYQLLDEASTREKRKHEEEYQTLIEMDKYAFEKADYILFPCEQADEPYIHEWPYYSNIKNGRKDIYRYLVTGTNPAVIKTERAEVRRKLNIPDDAFVISYVGRHNKIKGYDRLKEIGKEFLKKHPDAYILVAGKEEPITGLKHSHWVEIGWTTEPHSYVNASDVFVLPNRETYFDLVMLEVLSTGKVSVISNTGGNKYFKQFTNAGVRYFDNNSEAINELELIYNTSKEERNRLEEINKKIYMENFTTDIFAKNYIELYKSLV